MADPLCRVGVSRRARSSGRRATTPGRGRVQIATRASGASRPRTCSSIAGDGAQQYDVVVVGSGGGAMTGAFLAQRAGLSTVVVEKTALLGGTSAYSGGACWLPGQRRAAARRHPRLDRVGARRTSPRSWSTPTRRRSRRSCGTPRSWSPSWRRTRRSTSSGCRSPSTTTHPAGSRSAGPSSRRTSSAPSCRRGSASWSGRRSSATGPARAAATRLSGGQSLIARLLDGFLRDGGTVLTELPVTGLVLDGDRVAGVAAMTPEGPVEIRARRGVLVAAGGFEGNAGAARRARRPRRRRLDDGARRHQHRRADRGGRRDRRGDRLPRRRLVLPRAGAAGRRRLVHARLPVGPFYSVARASTACRPWTCRRMPTARGGTPSPSGTCTATGRRSASASTRSSSTRPRTSAPPGWPSSSTCCVATVAGCCWSPTSPRACSSAASTPTCSTHLDPLRARRQLPQHLRHRVDPAPPPRRRGAARRSRRARAALARSRLRRSRRRRRRRGDRPHRGRRLRDAAGAGGDHHPRRSATGCAPSRLRFVGGARRAHDRLRDRAPGEGPRVRRRRARRRRRRQRPPAVRRAEPRVVGFGLVAPASVAARLGLDWPAGRRRTEMTGTVRPLATPTRRRPGADLGESGRRRSPCEVGRRLRACRLEA